MRFPTTKDYVIQKILIPIGPFENIFVHVLKMDVYGGIISLNPFVIVVKFNGQKTIVHRIVNGSLMTI